jgi:phage-related baseplate assembly protein
MQLSLQNFSALVEGMAASVQGAAQSFLDLTAGSVLRAVLEANASVALWIQWLIVQVLSATRLMTSAGADVDSFGADFSFIRLPAVAASGSVTFSRFTPSISAFVPVGTVVSTGDNTQSFMVVADPTNATFSSFTNGFTLAAGLASLSVAVVAMVPGSAGNVLPGAISLLSSAVAGIDTVTNAAALTAGQDAESDAAFKSRFNIYLSGLSKATNISIAGAVASIQQGLSYQISENVSQNAATQMGHFIVTVDDGSGSPPASLLSTVWQAVNAVRPVGTSFAVQGPIVELANVALTLTTVAGSSHSAAVTAVAASIETYIAGLQIGAMLGYTKLAQLAYEASSSINNVSGLLLNGGTADIVPGLFGVVRTGTVTVT